MAEDDVLYHSSHFREYRPADDVFGYNKHKWGLYTWSDPPVYSFKNRFNMTSLIAPRLLLIETLEERFKKYPDPNNYPEECWGEPGRYEKNLGITPVKREEWFSSYPNVVFSHDKALGFKYLGTRKKLGYPVVKTIPYWGKAKMIRRIYE